MESVGHGSYPSVFKRRFSLMKGKQPYMTVSDLKDLSVQGQNFPGAP